MLNLKTNDVVSSARLQAAEKDSIRYSSPPNSSELKEEFIYGASPPNLSALKEEFICNDAIYAEHSSFAKIGFRNANFDKIFHD